MTWTPNNDIAVGKVTVATTSDGGHPPEFYAERICARLIAISETAPPEIRAQALAYREQMQAVLLDGIRRAILSNHTTLIVRLQRAGLDDAARFVRETGV